MEYNKNLERDIALDWDSEISAESNFKPIEDGEYAFSISGWERGMFAGSEKMIQCKTVDLEVSLFNEQGPVGTIRQKLFMTKKQEWKLSEFFISIGQKKPGEPFVPDWNKLLGAQGMCKVVHPKEKDGTVSKYARVDKFLPPKTAEEDF